jgi:hypothetical protein
MPRQYTPKDIERFWSKVDTSGECWEWTAGCVAGYGRININTNGINKEVGAHRVSYELHYGTIPEGLLVCHHCDNPRCVRPDHLFLGTPADNSKDAARKGRMLAGDRHPSRLRPETRPRGENNTNAKLTDEKVRAIRERHSAGVYIKALAREYGVDKKAIQNIVRRITWRHVN